MEEIEGVLCTVVSKKDFDKICRCCLSSDTLGSIFDLMYEETLLVNVLYSLFGSQLDPEDALPKKICEICISEVIRCYIFKKSFEASEAALRNIITIKTEDAELKEEPLGDNFEEVEETQPKVADQSEIDNNVKENFEIEHVKTQLNDEIVKNSKENKREENLERTVDVKKQKQSRILTCSCAETFTSKLEFRQHRQVSNHHIPRTHPCPICGKLFPKHSLSKHVKIHEAVKPYGCDLCDARFAENRSLQKHMLIHTSERPHICDICGKSFIHLDSMNAHRLVHTGEKLYLCAICGSSYRNKRRYNTHMQDHDQNTFLDPTTKIVCKECGRVCHNPRAYKLHLHSHGLGGQHQCEICKKFYPSQFRLRLHMRFHNDKNFLCNECGKVFRTKPALDSHYLSHTGEKPYACKFCDRKFVRQSNLVTHRLVHTGELPFACALCPKKFRQSAHLNRHLTVHTGERPYVCQICYKSYSQKGSLNIHVRTHTGEKPFKCDLCTSMFYESGSLKKHKQRKHQHI